jgi:hypothetical protein
MTPATNIYQWLADAFADKPLDLIYSSTSYRAFRTAEIINNNSLYASSGIRLTFIPSAYVTSVWRMMKRPLFFPSPTPEMAVRMSLLVRQPLLAFSSSIEKGTIVDDPQYGDLYIVNSFKRPFIYVKKTKLGWVANAGGTGP